MQKAKLPLALSYKPLRIECFRDILLHHKINSTEAKLLAIFLIKFNIRLIDSNSRRNIDERKGNFNIYIEINEGRAS